jgi:large conductance mechanosensitive channel
MGMMAEFKKFAVKGNAVDMAVGIIIGAGFGKIVSSFVNDLIMPPIGKLLGNVDFTDLHYPLEDKAVEVTAAEGAEGKKAVLSAADMSLAQVREAGIPTIAYGNALQTIVDFTIIAFCVFLLVRFINKLNKKEEEAPKPKEPSAEVKLLTEIRDNLAKKA